MRRGAGSTMLAMHLLSGTALAQQETATAPAPGRHVPPDPPSHTMPPMSNAEMIEVMAMDDSAHFGTVRAEQLEWRDPDTLAWDIAARYGGDYDKIALETEGARTAGSGTDARVELAWNRVITRWWNVELGARHDTGEGPSRTWAAFGLEGLAPFWLDIDATVYIGEQGRLAGRLEVEYEFHLTQRVILSPELDVDLYARDDPARRIGAGLSSLEAGVRLRYEMAPEFAPYLGLSWSRLFGVTADLAADPSDVAWVAGLRVIF